MAYHIDFDDSLVLRYVAGIDGLSTAAQADLLRKTAEELGRDADLYLHLYPHPPGGEGWGFEYFAQHKDATAGIMYHFRFVCDGGRRSFGVIRVRFVDYTTEPITESNRPG